MRTMFVGRLIALSAAIVMTTVAASALGAQDDDPEVRAQMTHDGHYRGWYRDLWPVRGVRIAVVEEGGTSITLRDGTVWEVYLPHRTSTAEWRRGDYVTVKPSPLGQDVGRGRYTFELFNGRAESVAVVKFRGRRVLGRRG